MHFHDLLGKTQTNTRTGIFGSKKGNKNLARLELEKALDLDQNFDGANKARQVLSKL